MLLYLTLSVGFVLSTLFFIFSLLFFIVVNFIFKDSMLFLKTITCIYKVSIVLGGLSLLGVMVFSLNNFLVVMMGSEVWFGQSPTLILDFESYLFVFMGSYVSWNIMRFGMYYMVDELLTFSFVFVLIVFMFLMLVLVMSYNFLFLFLSWEGVGLMSYILISWWFGRSEAVGMGMQAVIYNRVSDFSLLFFMAVMILYSMGLMMGWSHGLHVLFILFFLGVMAKSSQFLFHPWLPNAMEGPTPVSSLLHSSTMVVAGVLLLIRCYDLFYFSSLVFVISSLTCLLSGMVAASQYDVKKIIAYSTTSQLGFMLIILGCGFKGVCVLYMAVHGFFKAMMFMLSGGFIHGGVGSQDSRTMSSSVKMNSIMMYLLLIGAVVMMGFPFLSAFWFKDFLMENLTSSFVNRFMLLVVFLGLMYTVVYNTRLIFSVTMFTDVTSFKLVVQQSFMSFTPMYSLFVMSLLVGGYFWSMSPYYEINMDVVVKYWPLVGLFFSVSWVFLYFGGLSVQALYTSGYIRYYNPMVHKYLSKASLFFTSKFYLLDYVVFEFLFPYLLQKKIFYYYFFVSFLFMVYYLV